MRAEHAARSAATPKARDAAHPQEQRSCGTDVRSPLPPASLRAMGSLPAWAETAARVRCAQRIGPGPEAACYTATKYHFDLRSTRASNIAKSKTYVRLDVKNHVSIQTGFLDNRNP